MYDRINTDAIPRKHTVEIGKKITDVITVDNGARYGYSAHGPNGYVRQWGGSVTASAPAPPPVTSCHGYVCSAEGQMCPEGKPGASGTNYCCHDKKWIATSAATCATPPPIARLRYDVSGRRVVMVVDSV